MEKELVVGNLDAVRDWGFAGDYVEGMWMMLNARVPDDYVLASGETHTVRDFIQTAARVLGLSVAWEGKGDTEVGKDANGGVVVRVSKEFFRPTEKVDRRGDISKIQANVGWKPKTRFEELVRIMVEADVLKSVMFTVRKWHICFQNTLSCFGNISNQSARSSLRCAAHRQTKKLDY